LAFLDRRDWDTRMPWRGCPLLTTVVTTSSSSSSSCLHFFHMCLSSLLECIEEEEEEKERQAILLAASTSLQLRMSTRRPKSINWLNLHDRHKFWGKGRGPFP
jgi:hypothetical protein